MIRLLPLLLLLAAPALAQDEVLTPAAPVAPDALSLAQAAARQGDPAEALSRYLRVLATRPDDPQALAGAGRAALDVGDVNAAAGFLARAEARDPRNGEVKVGLASTFLQRGDYRGALRYFRDAVALGIPVATIAADRGLAYDLRGDQRRAQADYQLSLAARPDDETVRRLALSQAIAGDRTAALATLDPLLRRQDVPAWRARAFVFALTGDASDALTGAGLVMPRDQVAALAPYLPRLGALRPGEKAAAVDLGRFPGDAAAVRVAASAPAAPVRVAAASPVAAVPASPFAGVPAAAPPANPFAAVMPAATGDAAFDARARAKALADAQAEARARAAARAHIPAAIRAKPGAPAPVLGPDGYGAPPTVLASTATPVAVPPVALAAPEPAAAQPAAIPRPATRVPSAAGLTPAAPPPAIALTEPTRTVTAAPPLHVPPPAEAVAAEGNAPTPAAAPESAPQPAAPVTLALAAPAPQPVAPAPHIAPPPAAPPAPKVDRVAEAKARRAEAEKRKQAAAEAEEKKAKARDPARHWVQVAGGADKSRLDVAWDGLKAKWPKQLAGRSPWTTHYRYTNRLLIGPFASSDAAQDWVTERRKEGFATFRVETNAGDPVERVRD